MGAIGRTARCLTCWETATRAKGQPHGKEVKERHVCQLRSRDKRLSSVRECEFSGKQRTAAMVWIDGLHQSSLRERFRVARRFHQHSEQGHFVSCAIRRRRFNRGSKPTETTRTDRISARKEKQGSTQIQNSLFFDGIIHRLSTKCWHRLHGKNG